MTCQLVNNWRHTAISVTTGLVSQCNAMCVCVGGGGGGGGVALAGN